MIERVERTRHLETPAECSWSYNFAGASQLEISYRMFGQPLENEDAIQTLKLTFGIGSPPDFGQGELQSMILQVPPEWRSLAFRYSSNRELLLHEKEAAEHAITVLKEQEKYLNERVESLTKAFALTEKGSIAQYEAAAAIQAANVEQVALEGQIKAAESEVTKIGTQLTLQGLEKPEGWDGEHGWSPWTGPIIVQRSFDAVRFTAINGGGPLTSYTQLEERLVAYRPGDIGPTPVTAGGR